jgi:hypothetical protein
MSQRVLLDLFCGRWGWSRAFAKRGWRCIGVDLTEPPEVPQGCEFVKMNVLNIDHDAGGFFSQADEWLLDYVDAIVASSPCEEFSVHGMKHFHPNPKYPANGIRLFNHTRNLCEAVGVPYVMENVRAAQQFVGNAAHHCGPFYLWGNAVPPIVNQGIIKGFNRDWDPVTRVRSPKQLAQTSVRKKKGGLRQDEYQKIFATIPPELANCVADYIERLLEMGYKPYKPSSGSITTAGLKSS